MKSSAQTALTTAKLLRNPTSDEHPEDGANSQAPNGTSRCPSVEWSKPANKNTRHTVKCEFQINIDFFFDLSMSREVFRTYLYTKAVLVVYLKFRFNWASGSPTPNPIYGHSSKDPGCQMWLPGHHKVTRVEGRERAVLAPPSLESLAQHSAYSRQVESPC